MKCLNDMSDNMLTEACNSKCNFIVSCYSSLVYYMQERIVGLKYADYKDRLEMKLSGDYLTDTEELHCKSPNRP